jgi:phage-related minor tail protein
MGMMMGSELSSASEGADALRQMATAAAVAARVVVNFLIISFSSRLAA